MRYVAFIDTLGFKNKLQNMSHDNARELIRSFNREIFRVWRKLGYNNDQDIKGRTFSDSLIIYTLDVDISHLKKLINFLIEIYRVSILRCDLALRGGVAIGDYDDIKAIEFENLEKGIIVGNAFIDAYTLESANEIKGSKILLNQQIRPKIEECDVNYTLKKVKKDSKGKTIYELRWADIKFIIEDDYFFLNTFCDMACRSNWIDHYFGTIDTFLINEKKKKKYNIFNKIIEYIDENYNYSDLDNFIENFLHHPVLQI